MNRRELFSKVRRLGRQNGVSVDVNYRRGKGSHAILFYGDSFATVPDHDPIKKGTLSSILRKLGIERSELK